MGSVGGWPGTPGRILMEETANLILIRETSLHMPYCCHLGRHRSLQNGGMLTWRSFASSFGTESLRGCTDQCLIMAWDPELDAGSPGANFRKLLGYIYIQLKLVLFRNLAPI